MAIALRQHSRTHNGTGNNVVFSWLAPVEGNLLLAVIWAAEITEDAQSAPVGWTELASRQDILGLAKHRTKLWGKVAGAGETTTPTFLMGQTGSRGQGHIWEFSGAGAVALGAATETTYVSADSDGAVSSLQVSEAKSLAADQIALCVAGLANTLTDGTGAISEGMGDLDDYVGNSKGSIVAWSDGEQSIQPTASWTTAREAAVTLFGIGADPSAGGDLPFAAADIAAADIVAADIAAADIVAL